MSVGERNPRADRRRWVEVGLFLYLWLMIGFATGTAVLLFAARGVTGLLRDSAAAGMEAYAMWAVMAAFVIGSFFLSLWLWRRSLRGGAGRFAIPAVATMLASLALWGWSNPARYAAIAGGEESRIALDAGPEFVFGAYPDEARLRELKEAGFTAVVSLQHPAVVPIELQGIRAEKEAARNVGIPFVHAPMLPWVSDNEGALETIRGLVERGTGKYYVHCGLGRDRANVVKAMVERMGEARVATAGDLKAPRTFADRVAEGRFLMERGNFQVLAEDLWVVPYPNEREGFSKLFGGQVETVLMMMDPADPEQREWIAEGKRLFQQYGVPFRFQPYDPADPQGVARFARQVREAPRPTVVMVPFTRPCPRDEITRAFLDAYAALGGPPPSEVLPGDGDPSAEGRPLPCEGASAGS
ncbi:MAG: hypothetical protein KY466_00085 [Gemmatimonadetes bacterium]|nr:hypothetical protein [Gemmatimonadota bacterium]